MKHYVSNRNNGSIYYQPLFFVFQDVWDQNMNGTKYTATSLPTVMLKRGFKKPKQSKARWYLIIGVSIAIVVVAVAVIALAIHFAMSSNNEGEV